MISMKKKWTSLEYKQCSKDLDIITYLFSLSAKITMDYQRERLELMVIFIIFKPNNFLDVRNIYQDEASMDMQLNEFNFLTSTCWYEKFQPLFIDMTKDRYQGRYRLGLNSIFVPNSSPF